jgi:hypothetical protein
MSHQRACALLLLCSLCHLSWSFTAVSTFTSSGAAAAQGMRPALPLARALRQQHGQVLRDQASMMNKGFGVSKAKPPKFKYTGTVRPGTLSPTRPVPPEIERPEYAVTGAWLMIVACVK